MKLVRLSSLSALAAVVLFGLVYVATRTVQSMPWYKERCYRDLIYGEDNQRTNAASTLAFLKAEDYLLKALRNDDEKVRELARKSLEYIWFTAAGRQAFDLLVKAHQAAEEENLDEARLVLDQVIAKHPKFAEAWSRRAALYWRLGDYKKSLEDSEKALALNPNHYGAWQGLGICRLKMGDLPGAVRSLKTALRLLPFDESTRECLQQCEELMKKKPLEKGEMLII